MAYACHEDEKQPQKLGDPEFCLQRPRHIQSCTTSAGLALIVVVIKPI